jgi:ADP-ribose pyrophosphatase
MSLRKHRAPQLLCSGAHLHFLRSCHGWEYVRRARPAEGVAILAATDDSRLLLIEQMRPPLGKPVIELPAGLIDRHETAVAAARRELREETGYLCRSIKALCKGSTSPGLTDDQNTLCLASGLIRTADFGRVRRFADGSRKQAQTRGVKSERERLMVWEVPIDNVREWLNRQRGEGKIIDLRVYAGLFFLGLAVPEASAKVPSG